MYVTRPLSHYYNSPAAMAEPPPEGPGSGILVIEDAAAEEQATCCWGMLRTTRLFTTPFPQNKMIKVRYSTGAGESRRTYRDNVYFIPAVGQPLSSNRYYVVRSRGRRKGNTCTCSNEEEVRTFCFCTLVNDVEPTPFDHRNIYQQVEILPYEDTFRLVSRKGCFRAVSIASDGIPPKFLRRKGWEAYTSKPSHYTLGEALGINTTLRIQMPDLNFPISTKYSPSLVVGKWYCPYVFVKEREGLEDQMKRSMFYEMTLEQFWEEIYSTENYNGYKENVVEVGVSVKRETALWNGREIVNDDVENVNGVVWFKPVGSMSNEFGLSLPIWERMRWEEARGGWNGGEKVERVEKLELYEGERGWKKFGCYVLVERFVLKRMDGSLALTYDFKHTSKIRVKWE
ncbi:uncharacterized protein A4U43_C05F22810 [Asparagus officinalis]|uniref:Insecticidal crystal toxin domain-containing protein n=1 Tax=Asparagus officinalis TaxID=4686 RepID=A0A5P1EZ48_ASPOF|nr:uncharacterized protein LOC109843135 [Asparagus officinalis]ONK69430.1 uncharacterized protein A4U43_C05F22810 [Asparagus officinalis]